ncbi:MAG TPA: hypothetical protein VIJ07_10305 [Dermatophilaceae bacterium]
MNGSKCLGGAGNQGHVGGLGHRRDERIVQRCMFGDAASGQDPRGSPVERRSQLPQTQAFTAAALPLCRVM